MWRNKRCSQLRIKKLEDEENKRRREKGLDTVESDLNAGTIGMLEVEEHLVDMGESERGEIWDIQNQRFPPGVGPIGNIGTDDSPSVPTTLEFRSECTYVPDRDGSVYLSVPQYISSVEHKKENEKKENDAYKKRMKQRRKEHRAFLKKQAEKDSQAKKNQINPENDLLSNIGEMVNKWGNGIIDDKSLKEWKETLEQFVSETIPAAWKKEIEAEEKKKKEAEDKKKKATESKEDKSDSDSDFEEEQESDDPYAYDPDLCPYQCWREYTERCLKKDYRKEKGCPDLLFLTPITTTTTATTTTMRKMEVEELEEMVKTVLKDACVPSDQWKEVLVERAQEVVYKNVKLATRGNTISARYNKAEAFNYFLERENLQPKRIVFVDDNSDNVFSMFMYWAKRQLKKEDITEDAGEEVEEEKLKPDVYSVWYPPPVKAEKAQYFALNFIKEFSKSKDLCATTTTTTITTTTTTTTTVTS